MLATFKFFAYGILAVAAFLFLLYVFINMPESGVSPEVGQPLLYLGAFIVIAFIAYMFYKVSK